MLSRHATSTCVALVRPFPSLFTRLPLIALAVEPQASGVDPVVKVTVSNQKKHTRVQKTTVSPIYDEHMMFMFHEAPSKLFEELVVFQVFNSRKLRKDALIGSFSVHFFLCVCLFVYFSLMPLLFFFKIK